MIDNSHEMICSKRIPEIIDKHTRTYKLFMTIVRNDHRKSANLKQFSSLFHHYIWTLRGL